MEFLESLVHLAFQELQVPGGSAASLARQANRVYKAHKVIVVNLGLQDRMVPEVQLEKRALKDTKAPQVLLDSLVVVVTLDQWVQKVNGETMGHQVLKVQWAGRENQVYRVPSDLSDIQASLALKAGQVPLDRLAQLELLDRLALEALLGLQDLLDSKVHLVPLDLLDQKVTTEHQVLKVNKARSAPRAPPVMPDLLDPLAFQDPRALAGNLVPRETSEFQVLSVGLVRWEGPERLDCPVYRDR